MSARILDGKAIAKDFRQEVAGRVQSFVDETSVTPCLAAVLVGEDAASQVYVRNKRRDCESVGITSQLHTLPAETSEQALLDLVNRLNQDPDVHGILVQLPLPGQIRETHVLDAVHPAKDVDCFHPENVGRLVQGRPRFLPCTPSGVQQILIHSRLAVAGKHAVVVGRSEIVGKPMAALLIQRDSPGGPEFANATVSICHSRTVDLAAHIRQADVLIAALGRPRALPGEMLKPGAIVIDVGINRTDDGLCGDVDFDSASQVASAITPVPGGVGPLTRAMLLENTLRAAQIQQATC